ncbi:aquaporin [Nitrosomonas sp. Nm33]|uniref:aquaporin n=1 Tax=Nitrosomonas sp. Nm33 TaxID=133724 RepID=UPI00089B892C|nr:aquaporin [Nitrosomonas sp. Nm33]SDY93850.1 aquaporin Z [Nitrosomonas sp. Nm33]
MIPQVAGAVVAAGTAQFLASSATVGDTLDVTKLFIAEFLFAFALVYVILNAVSAKGTSSNSFYSFAIGFMLMTGTFSVAGMSNGIFNADVVTNTPLINLMSWSSIGVHLIVDLTGGILAVLVFIVLNQDDT